MNQDTENSKGISIPYMLKASAVCGKLCEVAKREVLADDDKKCLCNQLF